MAASLLVHGMESDELSASSFAFSSSDGDLPPAGDGVVVVPHEDGASKEGAGTSQSEISSDALLERLRKAEAALASRDALILSLEDDIDALIESHRRNQEEKYDALAEADEHIKALQGQIALLSDELTRSGAPQRRRRRKRMSRSADVSLETADADLAGLDLGGREDLVSTLSMLAYDPDSPATVLVSHHVEEIPPGFTHALMLRQGRVVAAGLLDQTVTEQNLSATFGMPLTVSHGEGRWAARRRTRAR